MKRQRFKWELFFIAISIIATLGLQIYWNIKNFQEAKERIINEVQIALDLSVEQYFATISKQKIITVLRSNHSSNNDSILVNNKILDSITIKQKSHNKTKITKDTKINTNIKVQVKSVQATKLNFSSANNISSIKIYKNKKQADTITDLKAFSDRLVISMRQDSIKFKILSAYLKTELNRKNIVVDYSIEHIKDNRVFDGFNENKDKNLSLETFSKSTYLSQNEKLKMNFSDPTKIILKRIFWTILLSILFSFIIISCLFYLLKIINSQKKIDTIKNDLISNITHEFKTPITTISSAIEGIRVFNKQNDTEKTTRYLDISQQQLSKLETMVEKILETATLQTNQLQLTKTAVNVGQLIHGIIQKFQEISPDNSFISDNIQSETIINVDSFHFENVITNLIDNAIKYGGNQITINVENFDKTIEILIADNGKKIEKVHQNKIFDQFYRIQTGNVHNIKGFGIGLYYAKQIIEKHHGKLTMVPNQAETIFKITLPNE